MSLLRLRDATQYVSTGCRVTSDSDGAREAHSLASLAASLAQTRSLTEVTGTPNRPHISTKRILCVIRAIRTRLRAICLSRERARATKKCYKMRIAKYQVPS